MLEDDLGHPVPLERLPTRVLSLVPSLTEALAVTVPDRLIGATEWCTHPGGLDVPRVRGTKNPNHPAMARLRPDLVIANQEENRRVDVERLRAGGFTVWVTVIESVDQALRSMRRLFVEVLEVDEPAWLVASTVVWGHPPELPLPPWACEVSIDDVRELVSAAHELLPGVAIQIPPNLSDWWPELLRAGASDLGGLSANGDHISPEHPFPSPHQVRRTLQADGLALTERLCVYSPYIDADWLAQGVLDVIKARYWSFIPRRGSGRKSERLIRRDLVSGAVSKGRNGVVLSED